MNHEANEAIAVPATHMLTKKDIVYRVERGNISMVICAPDESVMDCVDDAYKEVSSTMKTRIAREDGLVSIKSGFTRKELESFANGFPQMRSKIRWRWAFRYEWMLWHPKEKLL